MLNDAATNDTMGTKKEIGKDRPKRKAIDNPLFVHTVTEEAEGGAVEDDPEQETAAAEKTEEAARAIAPAPEARDRDLERHHAPPIARPRQPELERAKTGEAGGRAVGNKARQETAAVGKSKEAARAIPPVPEARDLEKPNAARLLQTRQLELERVKRETEESQERRDDFQDASQESQSIIQVVEALEQQLDDSFEIRDALAADLEAARAKLASEMAVQRNVAERLKLREAEAALVDPLRDQLSFVEQERNEIARTLKTNVDMLERTTKERDALAEKMAVAEDRIGELEGVNVDLEAQVLNLEELVHDLGGVRKELEGRNAQCEELTRRLRGVTGQLEATEISKKALELDLATNKKIGAESREEIKGLNQKIADMESELLDVSEQLEEQQVESADLRGRNKRLEQDLKSQVANNKTIMAELEASRKALHDVRTVATRTGKRVQTRHFESSTKTDGEETSTPVEE
jgi:hypothetical protein